MDNFNTENFDNTQPLSDIGAFDTKDTINTGIFDNPYAPPNLGAPDTNTQFDNPFANIAPETRPAANEDPFAKLIDADLRKGPSFEAQTAPGFFDWEGSGADRFVNSAYYKELGFNPNRDNETLYGNRQTWGNTLANALGGGWGLAWNTFKEGWNGWGRMVDALTSWDATKLMGTPEELDELNKKQNSIMNEFAIFKTPESENSIFNRQFLGDMIQQSGFAVGTLLQFGAEELLTFGASTYFKVGARAIEGVAEGATTEKAILAAKKLNDETWTGITATKLYKGLKWAGEHVPLAGNWFDAGLDIWKAKTYGTNALEIGAITLNGLKRTMAEANMAFTESRMEAAGTYGELKTQLLADASKKGPVSYEDEQRIEQMAQGAAWSNFKTNAAVLSIMNRLEYENMFQKFRSAKNVAREVAEAEIGEGAGAEAEKIAAERTNRVTGKAARDITNAAGQVTVKAGDPFTQAYEKGMLGTFGNLKKISADFGKGAAAWQATQSIYRNVFKWEVKEGIEELIQEESNNAIKDYYTDLYSYHGTGNEKKPNTFNWDIKDANEESNIAFKNSNADLYAQPDIANATKPDKWGSIDKALENLYSVNGLKIFIMGAATGRLLAPINKGIIHLTNKIKTSSDERQEEKKNFSETVGNVNAYFRDPMQFNREALPSLRKKSDIDEEIENANHVVNEYYSDPAHFAPEGIAGLKVQNVTALRMEDAIRNNDQYAYGHAQDSAFAKAVSSAKKLNMLSSMTDTMRTYGDHLDEKAFFEAYGLNFDDQVNNPNDGTRRTVKQYMNKLADEVQAFSNRYDNLRETYADLIQPERYKKGKDKDQASLAKRALDDSIEWIASNEYRAKRTAERRNSIIETASKLPTVGKSAYAAFRILGDDAALIQEKSLLEEEIKSMQGVNARDEASKQLLELKKQQYRALRELTLGPSSLEKVKNIPSEENTSSEEKTSETPSPEKATAAPSTEEATAAPSTEEATTAASAAEATATSSTEEAPTVPSTEEATTAASPEKATAVSSTEEAPTPTKEEATATPFVAKTTERRPGSYDPTEAIRDYINAKNKESNIDTTITPNDLQDLSLLLRDYRRLHRDGQSFMDAYALLADPKKFRGTYMRIQAGLQNLREQQKKANQIAQAKANASEVSQAEEEQPDVKAGNSIEEYHGYRDGDKINHNGTEYIITGISTKGVELSYGAKKTSRSLDRFDEMVAAPSENLSLVERKENFKGKKVNTQVVGGEGIDGVFIIKDGDKFYLTDEQGDKVIVEDETSGLSDEYPTFSTLAEAEAARKKLVASNRATKKEDESPYTFDGKKIKFNDILVDGENKRYRVLTKKEAETVDEKPTIKVQPIEGGEAIQLNDLKGYELALELARKRILSRGEDRRFKLKTPNISTRVSAVPKANETQAKADQDLQDFILRTPREDLNKNLTFHITDLTNKKSKTEESNVVKIVNAGKADENKNLRVNNPSLLVELKYNKETIGQLSYFDQYQFQDENGEPVSTDKLTAVQFAKIFDTSLADPQKLLSEFQQSYQQGKEVYTQLLTLMQGVKAGKRELSLTAKEVQSFFDIHLFPGVPDFVKSPGTPLKDLKYKGVNGKTAIITILPDSAKRMDVEGLITDRSLSAEEKVALQNRITNQRNIKKGGDVEKLGPYVAVVELPNKELQFLSLTTPAASLDELNKLVKNLNAQTENLSETEHTEKVKGDLVKSINNILARNTYVHIPGINMKVKFAILDGNLAVNFKNLDSGRQATATVKAEPGKPLFFEDFTKMLAGINNAIKEHDRNPVTPAIEKIGIQLTADNFRQYLKQNPDLSLINNMHVNVSPNVLRDSYISILSDGRTPSLFNLESRPPIAKENILQPEEEEKNNEPETEIPPVDTTTGEEAPIINKKENAPGSKKETPPKETKKTLPPPKEKPATPPSKKNAAAEEVANNLTAKTKELEAMQIKVFNDLKKKMKISDATAETVKHPDVVKLQNEIKALQKATGVPKIITSDELTEANVENIKKFEDWVGINLPKVIDIDKSKVLEANLLSKGITVGTFITYLKELSNGKKEARGTIHINTESPFKYHEAFHSVFRLLLTDKEINNYLDKAKKEVREVHKKENTTLDIELGKMRELSPEYYGEDKMTRAELEERYYEEYLADQFDKWSMDHTIKTDPANKNLFRRIWDWILGLLGKDTPVQLIRRDSPNEIVTKNTLSEIESLFYEINAKEFKGASIATNRFTTDPQLQVAPQVALKAIKIGEKYVQDEDGRVVKVNEYLPEEKGTPLAATLAAVFYNRSEKAAPGTSGEDILEEIFDDYTRLYDKDNAQYDQTRDEMGPELDKLMRLFSFGREELKEAVRNHLQNINYMRLEQEDDEEDQVDEVGDRTISEYGKSKESLGGFENLSKELRQYISTTVYRVTDSYGNSYLKDGEPLLQAVSANQVYSGILKAVAGTDDSNEMLLRMQEFAKNNEQSGHFIRRFFKDVGIKEVGIGKYEQMNELRGDLYMRVIKGFQQYTPDYLYFIKDIKNQTTKIERANVREASKAQFSIWHNAYNHVFGEQFAKTATFQKSAFLRRAISGFEAFNKNASRSAMSDEELSIQSKNISDEIKRWTGMNFHPLFIKYSLISAFDSNNHTEDQKRIAKAFEKVKPMEGSDADELSEVITSGKSPFLYDWDIEKLEEKRGKRYGSNADMRLMIKLAQANSIFDETVNTTSFRNAANELVQAHQLPTFHLIKISELASNPDKVFNELSKNPFMARNFLTTREDFLEMAKNLELARLEGMSQGRTNELGEIEQNSKGVTYGDFTGREMGVILFELYGINDTYKTQDGKEVTTSRHLNRVIEATNTGDSVNLPIIQATEYKGGKIKLSDIAVNAMLNDVQSEFERIIRVKKEKEKIDQEKDEFEKNGTPRTTEEIDDYHNGKTRGDTMFKTGVMLGNDLTSALEQAAQEDNPKFDDFKSDIKEQLHAYWTGKDGLVDELVDLLKEKDIIRAGKKEGELENILLPKFLVEGFKKNKEKITEEEKKEKEKIKKEKEANRNLGNDIEQVEAVEEEEEKPDKNGLVADKEKNKIFNLIPGDLRHNIAQVLVNDFLNTNAFNQLLLGDQATSLKDFVDMVKRAKGANGSGASIRSEVIAPSLGINHPNLYSHVVHINSPQVAKMFPTAESKTRAKADSQMWITLKALRYTLFGVGKLTLQRAQFLDKIKRGESVQINDVFGKGGSIEFNGQTNSIKLMYYDGPRYIKTSGFLLTKEFTSLENGQARRTRKELHDLRTKLEAYEDKYDTICMAIDKTASKGEKANVANKIADITDFNFIKLDNRFWRLQSENPSNKLVITDPTQVKQMIMSEQDDDLLVHFAWNDNLITDTKITVGELKKLYMQNTAQRENVKYEQVRNDLFSFKDVVKEISLSLQQHKITPKLAEFQKRAIEILRVTGADSQMLEFFSLDDNGDPKYNLNQPAILDKFTQMFLAYFSKGVMNEKIPGRAVTMVSNFGAPILKEVLELKEDGQPKRWRPILEKEQEKNPALYKDALEWEHDPLPSEPYRNNEEREENASTNRKFYSLREKFEANQAKNIKTYVIDDLRNNVPEYEMENGKIKKDENGNEIIKYTYNEMMMPPHTREEMELMNEGGEIPEVVALSFGTRIPTLDRGSGSVNKIVDFLPAYYGSSAMFAPEVLEASDADFDLDKQYMSTKDYYTRKKNGKTEFVEYGKTIDPEEQFDEYVRYQKSANPNFRRRYKELLAENREKWKEEVQAMKEKMKTFDEDFEHRVSSKQRIEDFHTINSVNAFFDAILGTDTAEEESRIDFDYLMDGLEQTALLDKTKGELYSDYENLLKQIRNANQKATSKTLGEFSMPRTAKEYAQKIEKDKEQNVGKLNNMILDAKIQLQSNQHMVSGENPIAYRPTTPGILTDLVERLKGIFPILENIFEEGKKDVDTIIGKIGSFQNVKDGSNNIAPAVNSMLTYALFNTFGVGLREKTSGEKKKEGRLLWLFKLNGVPFNSYEHKNSYNPKTKKYDGERIFSVISSIVAAMTDNAKERLASKLGLNIEAVGLVSNLVAQGVPLDSAVIFVLQPVVRKYYQQTQNYGASIKTNEEEGLNGYTKGREMLAELKAMLPNDTKPLDLTDEILYENINTKGKNAHYEYSVLDSFLKLQRQTKYFSAVADVMKLAKGMGTSHEAGDSVDEKIDFLKLNTEDTEFNHSYVPIDVRQVLTGKNEKANHNYIVANYLKIFNEIRDLSKTIFLERTDFFRQMTDAIKGNLNVWGYQAETFKKQLKRDLISFLGIKAYMKLLKDENRQTRSLSLTHAMVLEAEAEKMPETFMDIIDVVRAVRARLKDNYFANKFLNAIPTAVNTGVDVVENPYNDTGVNKAEVGTWAKLNQLQIEKLQDSFLDIYQNESTRPLAWSLFHYLLVKDGGQFRNGSFIRYIPNFMFQDLLQGITKVNEVMANKFDDEGFKRVFGVNSDALFNEFVTGYLKNIGNSQLVPQIEMDISPKKLALQKTGKEAIDNYMPETYGLSKDNKVLDIDMWRGSREKASSIMKEAQLKEEGTPSFNDIENARLGKNKESLRKIGFRTEDILSGKGTDVSRKTFVQFPYVIKRMVEGWDARKKRNVLNPHYYILQSVNRDEKGEQRRENVSVDPSQFLDSKRPIVLATKARYVLYGEPDGIRSEWKGAFVYGVPDTTPILRSRPAILNHPGFDLDEEITLPAPTKQQKKMSGNEWVESYQNAISDFEDQHGVQIYFENGKGMQFEKDGKFLFDQKYWKELFEEQSKLYYDTPEEGVHQNLAINKPVEAGEEDPDYNTNDQWDRTQTDDEGLSGQHSSENENEGTVDAMMNELKKSRYKNC